jgi:hypothetical protein
VWGIGGKIEEKGLVLVGLGVNKINGFTKPDIRLKTLVFFVISV